MRGVGPVLAAVFVAEIGDVTRFGNPRPVVFMGRADPTSPRVRQPRRPRQDHQTRLPAVALGRRRSGLRSRPRPEIASIKARVGARRGRNIGRVAAARHLLTLVYYGLRDGEIRCLASDAA